jgi:(1->4)-alpha-D-glucan 1-alpha-D-glucosylmutase
MTDSRGDVIVPDHRRLLRPPTSTYRLQLNAGFTFEKALEITDYLHQLGITDCYASPLLTARPGSSHGYDVCNFGEVDPAIGGANQFERWSERLRTLGMGLLVDVVPNHMAADPLNPWWRHVLQHGPSSRFARWFDIDWDRADPHLHGKVLLPILEDHYWRVLEAGKLRLAFEGARLVLAYHQHRLPLSPQSVHFFREKTERFLAKSGESSSATSDLRALITKVQPGSSGGCPTLHDPQPHGHDEYRVDNPQLLQHALTIWNGRPGDKASFDLLHALLERQHYRLGYWRVANEDLNYRRFFDVAELAALRMELPEVFEVSHELILRLVAEGKVTGLRVDHPDGLWDPAQYFARLQEAIGQVGARRALDLSARESQSPNTPYFYIVAEKILTGRERLPAEWQVAGTTGYDFLNLLNGLFLNAANQAAMDEAYQQFAAPAQGVQQEVFQSKLKTLRHGLAADLRALCTLLKQIAARTRYGADFSARELQDALAMVIAAFPVYRTYMTERSTEPAPEERAQIETAIRLAMSIDESRDPDVFSFLEDLLLLRPPQDLDEGGRKDCRRFIMRFQQLTGPVMAKGLEDTTFYHFNRFISLNEVGGAPDHFGTSLELFHRENAWRAEHWPHTLLATATHDTKRGEDLRARLNVLSEIPDEWRQAALKWQTWNAEKKSIVDGVQAPDANDEYFLYQVLVGAWDSAAENGTDSTGFRRRISDYMLKAIREAKAHTSWTEPHPAYEQATEQFINRILSHERANLFLDDFMLFQRKVAFFGLFNSLAQVLLKMTVPGVPDFYQGTELWDYTLVDPDNRRPVDYSLRKRQLADLQRKFLDETPDHASLIRSLLPDYQSGQIKQFVIWKLLQFRRRHRTLFEDGRYLPFDAVGAKRDHVCAFGRAHGTESIIVVASRLVLGLTRGAQRGALESDAWQGTSLTLPATGQGTSYRNIFTGQILTLGSEACAVAIPDLLGLLPVAVLECVS